MSIMMYRLYIVTNELTPLSTVFLEKLIVTHLVKNFPLFMEPEGSLTCSQEPVIGPCPESQASSPHLRTLLPHNPL